MLLILDELKDLFKDEASFRLFIQKFQDAIKKGDMPIVLSGRRMLFTAVSPEKTQEILCERILKRFAENPALLEEVKDRLEKDAIVE